MRRENLKYANLEDSRQRGANLAAAIMLNANLEFADMYGTRLCKILSKVGKKFL